METPTRPADSASHDSADSSSPEITRESRLLLGLSLVGALVGIVLLAYSLILWVGRNLADAPDDPLYGQLRFALAFGIGLTVLGAGLSLGRILDWLGRRLHALNVIVMVFLAFLLVVFANWIGSRHQGQFDWTKDRLYSISDETARELAKLEKNVEITLLLPGSKQQDLDALRRLLDQYKEKSPKVKFTHVDPALTGQEGFLRIVRQLNLVGRSYADLYGVVVQGGSYDEAGVWKGEQSKHIPVEDLYEATGGGGPEGGERTRVFKGEQLITSAILEVTKSSKPKAYFLTGHGELELENMSDEHGLGGAAKLLRQKNYDLATLKLLDREKGEVPKDAGALVIAGPKTPIPPSELVALETYLSGGGHLFVFLDPVVTKRQGSDETTFVDLGIEALLKKYNVDVPPRAVVGSGLALEGSQVVTRPTEQLDCNDVDRGHEITKLIQGGVIRLYDARPLVLTTANPHAKGVELVRTPSSPRIVSTGRPDELYATRRLPADGERQKAFVLAVAVEAAVADAVAIEHAFDAAPRKRATRIVVVGDSDWASNALVASGDSVNLELLMNALSWLVGQEQFVAKAKRPHSYKLELRPAVAVHYQLLAFPGLPLIPILIAGVVFIVRRS